MPHNRTKHGAKREGDLTPGELLDVCGPSDAALLRTARTGPTAQEKKHRRREIELEQKRANGELLNRLNSEQGLNGVKLHMDRLRAEWAASRNPRKRRLHAIT